MHAANLLNKRRREEKQRDDHPKLTAAAVAERDRDHRAVTKKTNSQTSFLDSIAGGVSTPTSSSAPALPTVYRPPICTFPPPPTAAGGHGNGYGSSHDPHPPEPLVLYHKQERISCAHIGLCVMIVGTIVTILAGFVCYLLGFGEPGVIIGGGGGIITIVGLVLLCFGSRWHLDELRTKKLPLIDYPLLSKDRSDLEAGRQAETLEVSKVTNPRSDLNGKSGKAIVALKAPALEIDMICEEPETSGACACTVNSRLPEEQP